MKLGKIYVVGIGPGLLEYLAPAGLKAIRESDVVVGYKLYLDIIKDIIDDKPTEFTGMTREVERCKRVIELAEEGKTVSLISSGDSGLYGMAGILLEMVSDNISVEIIPGITASSAAASSLGAPIMHDYVTISLSDLLTDWDLIKKRLHCAGEGDFVVAIYNPKSKGRPDNINVAREILLKYKSEDTPVGIVRNAKRDGEEVKISTLGNMLNENIDMVTMVIVGNSKTYIKNGKMITPRGYKI
jgi:precorrin-3B C17-methyltransferase